MIVWIRTATSLISFGFSIYMCFDLTGIKPTNRGLIGPQLYATATILTGLGALTLAVLDHRASMKDLLASGTHLRDPLARAASPGRWRSLAFWPWRQWCFTSRSFEG